MSNSKIGGYRNRLSSNYIRKKGVLLHCAQMMRKVLPTLHHTPIRLRNININSIRPRSLQNRHFRGLPAEIDADYVDLLLHTNVK